MGARSDFEVEVTSHPCEITFLYSIDVTSMMTKLQMMKIPRVWPYIVQSHLAWGRELTLRLNKNVHARWECVCGVGMRWLWVMEGACKVRMCTRWKCTWGENVARGNFACWGGKLWHGHLEKSLCIHTRWVWGSFAWWVGKLWHGHLKKSLCVRVRWARGSFAWWGEENFDMDTLKSHLVQMWGHYLMFARGENEKVTLREHEITRFLLIFFLLFPVKICQIVWQKGISWKTQLYDIKISVEMFTYFLCWKTLALMENIRKYLSFIQLFIVFLIMWFNLFEIRDILCFCML